MVKSVEISDSEKCNHRSFLLVKKQSRYYQLYNRYSFWDFKTKDFLSKFHLYSIKLIKMKDITNQISFLDKDVTRDIYLEIMKKIYNVKDKDMLYVMVFSTVNPIML